MDAGQKQSTGGSIGASGRGSIRSFGPVDRLVKARARVRLGLRLRLRLRLRHLCYVWGVHKADLLPEGRAGSWSGVNVEWGP